MYIFDNFSSYLNRFIPYSVLILIWYCYCLAYKSPPNPSPKNQMGLYKRNKKKFINKNCLQTVSYFNSNSQLLHKKSCKIEGGKYFILYF